MSPREETLVRALRKIADIYEEYLLSLPRGGGRTRLYMNRMGNTAKDALATQPKPQPADACCDGSGCDFCFADTLPASSQVELTPGERAALNALVVETPPAPEEKPAPFDGRNLPYHAVMWNVVNDLVCRVWPHEGPCVFQQIVKGSIPNEADTARAERNGLISRLRARWPHIEIAKNGQRVDPGPPTCLRCRIEDEIGSPWHDGLGPARGQAAYATPAPEEPHEFVVRDDGSSVCARCSLPPMAHLTNLTQPAPEEKPTPDPGFPMDGVWRCSGCGDMKELLNAAWRWNGERWEHRCAGRHPQAGTEPADYFGPTPAPEKKPALRCPEKATWTLGRVTDTLQCRLPAGHGEPHEVRDPVSINAKHVWFTEAAHAPAQADGEGR